MVPHRILQPPGWAPAKGYANGVAATGTPIYVAGQIGWNAAQQFESDDLVAQVRRALANVRGVLATAHVFVEPGTDEKDLFKAYRQTYRNEPFVRIVKERTGLYRYPEPKILAGSNYADVGFELDPATGRVVAMAAIDNLMKGAAGSAVQAMNVMCGWEETAGLGFAGLHPV